MGGAHGRMGGQIGAAARLRTSLSQAPRFRVVQGAALTQPLTVDHDVLDNFAAAAAAAAEMARENAALRAQVAALTARSLPTSVGSAPGSRSTSRSRRPTRSSLSPGAAQQPTPNPELRSRAASAPPRARGATKADRAVLGSVHRGQVLQVVPGALYQQYTFDDVCACGAAIKDGRLGLRQLKKPEVRALWKVPYETMRRWCAAADDEGTPTWLKERDQRRRVDLPRAGGVKGGGSVLGLDPERKIMLSLSEAAEAGCPFLEADLTELVRTTLVNLGVKIARTGELYTMQTDVSSLVEGVLRRARERGIRVVPKRGRKLAIQRFINQTRSSLVAYAEMINPELMAFQDKHGKLRHELVGNWDETGIDLCAFASLSGYLLLEHFGNGVAVPFEQSPHITALLGFVNGQLMIMLLVIKGPDDQPPSPCHAQLLGVGSRVYIAQSPTGWITNAHKAAFLRLQLEHGIIGKKPVCINVDGHDSNVNNEELAALAKAHNIFLCVPPSHTSAAQGGMGTQQCDRPAHEGGPIACFKSVFYRLLSKQFRANMRDPTVRSTVTIAEIAALASKAWGESFKPSKMPSLNFDVGYFNDPAGYLQWDLPRLLPAEAGGAAAVQSNFGGRADVQASQQSQLAALARERAAVDGIMAVHRATHGLLQPVVQRPTEPIKRGQAERKHNRFGCLVGGEQWLASREDRIERARAAEAKKADKGARFWERNRPDVRAAESALALSNGDPSKLSVKLLKAIVVSRTGSCAKSKNNKNGELLSEALTALSARGSTLIPPSPLRPTESGDDSDDDAVCPVCELSIAHVEPDENGMMWCECGCRLDE